MALVAKDITGDSDRQVGFISRISIYSTSMSSAGVNHLAPACKVIKAGLHSCTNPHGTNNLTSIWNCAKVFCEILVRHNPSMAGRPRRPAYWTAVQGVGPIFVMRAKFVELSYEQCSGEILNRRSITWQRLAMQEFW